MEVAPIPHAREKARTSDREGEVLYRWFRAEITAAFGMGRPREERCGPVPDGCPGGPIKQAAACLARDRVR
jgi:hypothetical protein